MPNARLPLSVAAIISAAALLAACGQNGNTMTARTDDNGRVDRPRDTNTATERQPTVAESRATGDTGMRLAWTGCLQKMGAPNTSYVLTMVSAADPPSGAARGSAASQAPIGTTGGTVPDSGARPRTGWPSYQLAAPGQDLERFVGQQIRVEGTAVSTRAMQQNTADRPLDTAGQSLPFDPKDLGRIEVSAVAPIAERCRDERRQREPGTRGDRGEGDRATGRSNGNQPGERVTRPDAQRR